MLLPGDLDVCGGLFTEYRAEAARRRPLVAVGGVDRARPVSPTMTDAQGQAEPYRGAHDAWCTPFGFPKGGGARGGPGRRERPARDPARGLAFDEVFLWIDQGLSEIGEVREGLELFAARVMPRFA